MKTFINSVPRADTAQLQAAQAVIRASFTKTVRTLRGMGTRLKIAALQLKKFALSKVSIRGLSLAIKGVWRATLVGARGVKRMGLAMGGLVKRSAMAMGALRGFAASAFGLLGPLLMIGSAVLNLVKGTDSMSESMGGAATESEDAATGVADVGQAAAGAAGGMAAMGDAAEESQKKIGGLLGAFGTVGAGFVQGQGKAAQDVESQSDSAVSALGNVDSALGDTETGVASMEESTSRLGGSWVKIMGIFKKALQKVLLPLLEKVADMLEDPRFIEFVELLADDLANALGLVVDWIIKKAIPALLKFMKKVSDAGGPVAYLKKKWTEFKATFMRLVAIIAWAFLRSTETIRGVGQGAVDFLKSIWSGFRDFMAGIWTAVKVAASIAATFIGDTLSDVWDTIVTAAQTAFDALPASIQGIFESIVDGIRKPVNIIIDIINDLISTYNLIAGALGLPLIDFLKPISLAQGGIINSPRLAIVGDNPTSPEVVAPLDSLVGILQNELGGIINSPQLAIVGDNPTSPEVVAPLDSLVGILQNELGGTGGGIVIEQIIVQPPPGMTNPEATGRAFGQGIAQGLQSQLTQMRQAGVRLPV